MTNAVSVARVGDRYKLYFEDYPRAPLGPRCCRGEPWPWPMDEWDWGTEDEAWEKALLAMLYFECCY